jgi:lipoprotein signal peptidase
VGRLWRDYSLSITAAVLFLITWLVYAVVEWFDFKNEMSWYGEPVAFGPYLTRFLAFSLENWQSEFLHIFFLVWLTPFLSTRGAPSPGTATTGWRRRSSASRGGSTR